MGHPHLKNRLTVITGHYGCGKTNFAINLALDLAAQAQAAGSAPCGGDLSACITLVDLDVVNPYFRSSDYAEMLAARGVRVIAPSFAGTTLDTPVLPADIHSVFDTEGRVIFDVGGDDVGATAIGQYASRVEAAGYDMLYVVNRYRNLTSTPQEAADLLGEIEAASHLKATAIVNNSHLRDQTTVETVLDSIRYAREASELLGLPLACTTVPRSLASELSQRAQSSWAQTPHGPGVPLAAESAYPIDVYVRPPWEIDSHG